MLKKLPWIMLVLLSMFLILFSRDILNIAKAQNLPNPDNIVLILDNSGSMKESDSSRPKIDAAIDVVQRNIDNQSLLSSNMGLVTLGGKCKVDRLVDLGSGEENRQKIKSKLNSIERSNSTAGATPLVEAIKTALSMVENKSGTNRIILISDGLPNCGQPNDWDKRLQEKGIYFDMDIIGYGVKQENDKEFKCIDKLSKRFGYYIANNEKELEKKFDDSMKKPIERNGSINFPTPSPTPNASSTPGSTITNGGGIINTGEGIIINIGGDTSKTIGTIGAIVLIISGIITAIWKKKK
jgi:uncharacterized protein YegL